jgi:hypothetical protein
MFKKKIAKSVDPAKTNKYFSKVFYAYMCFRYAKSCFLRKKICDNVHQFFSWKDLEYKSVDSAELIPERLILIHV